MERELELLSILNSEVKPALGCTEPIAVALAVAKAADILEINGRIPTKIAVEVSANILKNGMGVGIPGTSEVGLYIASALGALCGNSSLSLQVLRGVGPECVERAKEMIAKKIVTIKEANNNSKKLFIEASLYFNGNHATVIIEDEHDNIIYTALNGKEIKRDSALEHQESDKSGGNGNGELQRELTIETIYNFAKEVELQKIEFILESSELNSALAEEGLSKEYGLSVGRNMVSKSNRKVFGDSILTHAMAFTAAASDARMSGSSLPAMSNSGSGNQGITATLPVTVYANRVGASREELARALIVSHLIAILLKVDLGKLSALCGCVTASTGAASAIVFLEGGSLKQVEYAIHNMVGNLAGMACDGAKAGCAIKVATGVAAAINAATLALNSKYITKNEGIVAASAEGSIKNLGQLGSEGMSYTDKLILKMMLNK